MKILITILFLLSHNASANNSNAIDISVSDVAPISYMKEGKLTGINIDIIKQLEKESQLNFNLTLYPHGRLKKILEGSQTDLLIIFKVMCRKYAENYEMQDTPLYSLPPVIHLKKSVNPKKQSVTVARVIGTCSGLANYGIKTENIVEVANMEQAFKMLKAKRIDGVCGNDPVYQYNINQNIKLKNKLYAYKTVGNADDYRAVICRRKTLSSDIKNKLERGGNKIKVPSFNRFY